MTTGGGPRSRSAFHVAVGGETDDGSGPPSGTPPGCASGWWVRATRTRVGGAGRGLPGARGHTVGCLAVPAPRRRDRRTRRWNGRRRPGCAGRSRRRGRRRAAVGSPSAAAAAVRSSGCAYSYGGICSANPWWLIPAGHAVESRGRGASISGTPRSVAKLHGLADPVVAVEVYCRTYRAVVGISGAQGLDDRVAADDQFRGGRVLSAPKGSPRALRGGGALKSFFFFFF